MKMMLGGFGQNAYYGCHIFLPILLVRVPETQNYFFYFTHSTYMQYIKNLFISLDVRIYAAECMKIKIEQVRIFYFRSVCMSLYMGKKVYLHNSRSTLCIELEICGRTIPI